MENKVRLSYAVPLSRVPSEVQGMMLKAREYLNSVNERFEKINFVENFDLASHEVKALAVDLDSFESNIADVMLISEGYMDIQQKMNQAATDPTTPEDQHSEVASSEEEGGDK